MSDQQLAGSGGQPIVPFASILGQEPAVETLRRALASGRAHHAYRFEGPEGVGKEKTAFELAAALVCTEPSPGPCARCYHRVTTFSPGARRVPLHPDVVLVERGLYPDVVGASELTGISVEQIRRVVLARAGFPPHEGRALVFIVRDADQLTQQAANALLKTLEEPGQSTYFVLLTSRPKRLLDAVLSRSLPVRFGPLPAEALERILNQHGLPASLVDAAQGSAAEALRFADPALLSARQEFANGVREAVEAPDLTRAMMLAESRPSERASLVDQLAYLALEYAARARAETTSSTKAATQLARAHGIVTQAMRDLERNGQPALVLEGMILRLRKG